MRGRAFFHKNAHCPNCGGLLDAASHSKGEDIAPTEGDVGICFRCQTLLVYNADGIPEKAQGEVLARLDADPFVQGMIKTIKEFWDEEAKNK